MVREQAIKILMGYSHTPQERAALEVLIPELAESEDEKMINELQGFLDSFGAEYFGTGKWQKFHDWLKSLRPSWKPSEVQMAMLLAVINDPNNAGAESCQIALRELYKKLKGLKEGEK